MDKSRSKEKGGEPEMFLEDAGILLFGGQTCGGSCSSGVTTNGASDVPLAAEAASTLVAKIVGFFVSKNLTSEALLRRKNTKLVRHLQQYLMSGSLAFVATSASLACPPSTFPILIICPSL